jgi:class 3 adenylate cyclase
MDVNYALFYYLNGTLGMYRVYDSATLQFGDVPEELAYLPLTNPLMYNVTNLETRTGGFVIIDGKLVMMVAIPIQPSSMLGDTSGMCVFGKIVRPDHIMSLSLRTQYCVSLFILSDKNDPIVQNQARANNVKPIIPTLASPDWENRLAYSVGALDQPYYSTRQCYNNPRGNTTIGSRIGAYAVFADVYGNNSFIVLTDIARDVNDLGNSSMGTAFGMLAIVAVVSIVAILIFIERGVLYPILRLKRDVREIASKKDFSLRVAVKSRDEVGVMADDINEMMRTLQNAHRKLSKEKERSEQLLLNMLPAAVSEKLKGAGVTTKNKKKAQMVIADAYPESTVLFSDIVKFTDWAGALEATKLVEFLNIIFSAFDDICEKLQIEKIKTIGDAFMCVSGVPIHYEDHARRAIEQGLDMIEAINFINQKMNLSLRIRIGVNSGPVVAGVIGSKKYLYDLWGDAVNVSLFQVTYQIGRFSHGKSWCS